MHQPSLILASRSPRRRELLTEAGFQFQIIAPDEDVECGVCSTGGPAGLVTELAYRKAAAVIKKLNAHPKLLPASDSPLPASALVLAADTVAECNGQILGKPRDETDARRMLTQLANCEHRVLTGICLWPLSLPLPVRESRGEAAPLIRVAVTKLRMDPLSDAQLDDYLASGQWEGKAGAFGYQDRLGWVHIVEGSASNVVGLPMELLAEMLSEIARPD
jgi:septum formation protein